MPKPNPKNRPVVKPFTGHNGITLDQWRSDSSRLRWAQQEPIFREIMAVVHNESFTALAPVPNITENCRLGRAEGYQMAFEVLLMMTQKMSKPVEQPEPTYLPDDDKELKQRMNDIYD